MHKNASEKSEKQTKFTYFFAGFNTSNNSHAKDAFANAPIDVK